MSKPLLKHHCGTPPRVARVALPGAAADVVASAVAEDVVEGVLDADVAARLADHDAELALVVGLERLLRDLRDGDVVGPARDAGAGLDEDGGVGRRCAPAFFDVLHVVQANAFHDWDVGGLEEGEELGDFGFWGVG